MVGEEQSFDDVILQMEDDDGFQITTTTIITTTSSDFHYSTTTASCRICHEDEDELDWRSSSIKKMKLEAPCACSGTAKYAHRHCIQRWCDIKGDTTCEICLQKFEPDYTAAPPKKKEKVYTIRRSSSSNSSSSDSSSSSDEEEEEIDIEDQTTATILLEASDVSDCISAAERSASFCKTVAILLTVLLVVRQLLSVLTEDYSAAHYPFSLLTIFGLRACGVVIPMYMIIHSLSALQKNIRRQRLLHQLPLSLVRRMRRRNAGHVSVDIQSSL